MIQQIPLHKTLSTFLLCFLGAMLFSCQFSTRKAMENSRFMGKLTVGDTLKVINAVFYCEDGPITESYYFYYPTNSNDMICNFRMEWGWDTWKISNEGVIKEETYQVSPKAIRQFLKFEQDVINQSTGDDGNCTTYEFFDIILKNDTASSAHNTCEYIGFLKVRKELRKNIISEKKESESIQP